MKVLISIKPVYANQIFDGRKWYEYRKSIFKRPDIKIVVVYASSPVQRVIGEFQIESIIEEHPATIWSVTKDHSGVSERLFFDYFKGMDKGYAIKVSDPFLYPEPLNLKKIYQATPPQSFCYIR